MARLFPYRGPGLLLFLLLYLPVSNAQTLTADQQKACERGHENAQRCLQLVQEFATDHELLRTNASGNLDFPFGDTKAVINKVASRAILVQIKSDLKDKAEQAAQTALQTISTSAAVNQNGGAPMAGGSTNLVSKPTTTDFISLASESGAFTDTINGTTATVQANVLGLTKYFLNRPVFQEWRNTYADVLQPLTFTVTLNVAQTGSSTATVASSANAATPTSIGSVLLPTNNASFSSFGANYVVYRRYNPQDKKFMDKWKEALSSNQSALDSATKSIEAVMSKLFTDELSPIIASQMSASLTEWHQEAVAAEKANDFNKFVLAYAKYENAFCDAVLASSPDAPKNVLTLSQAIDAFSQVVYTVLDQARGKPLATLSYLYSSPEGKPATHSFTAVVSYLFKGDDPKKRTPLTGAQLTANFTTSIYASLPAGAAYGRLRDFQLSGEFDKPFGGTPDEPRGTWSLAGYGQYQYDPTVLNITAGNLAPGTNIALPSDAQVLLGTAGWLGVAQGKVVINLKKGLNIPVALKWSNKTDLLKGSDVRGQVGISYDLSALSKLLSGGSN
jgi:hypothetical protein